MLRSQTAPLRLPAPPPWAHSVWGRRAWRLDLLARVFIPLAALGIGGWKTGVAALVLQELGRVVAKQLSSDTRFGVLLFTGAFALRAMVASVLHVALVTTRGNGAVLQDDATYDLVAYWLVRIGNGEGISIFTGHQHLLNSLYLYLLAAIYWVVGYAPLVPKLLNCALGAVIAVLVAEIGTHAFSRTVGRIAGVAMALLPGLVFWSAVTMKEMLTLLAIVGSLRAIQVIGSAPIRSGQFASAAVALMASFALLDNLRAPMGVILLCVLLAMLIGRMGRTLRPIQGVIAGAVVLGLLLGGLALVRVRAPDSSLAKLTQPDEVARTLNNRRAREAAAARSQFGPEVDPLLRDALEIPGYKEVGLSNIISDLVEPLGFALFAPAPWQARSMRDLLASGEMLIWYAATLLGLVSWVQRPRQPLFALVIALYGGATLLLLAFAEGNLGNLLRHRMMLTPTYALLGAAGGSWLWSLRTRQSARDGRDAQPARHGIAAVGAAAHHLPE